MSSNPRVVEALEQFAAGLNAGRLAHAYLVVGPVRSEGTTFAVGAAQRLFCEARERRPCGACRACRRVESGVHPDALWLEPSKKSRIIPVEDIRKFQEFVFRTSYEGGWKVGVLVGADRLGAEAGNAFLKTLEEPPPQVLLLLLTEQPQGVLPTIVSRCQRFVLATEETDLPEPWRSALLDWLAMPVVEGDVAGMSRAGALLKILKGLRAKAAEEIKEESQEEELDDETEEARVEARYREWRLTALRVLCLWHRDLLACRMGADESLWRWPDRAETIRRKAAGLTWAAAMEHIAIIEEMQRLLDRNLPEETVFPFCVGRLRV